MRRTSPNTQVYSFTWQQPHILEEKGVNDTWHYHLLNAHTRRPIDTDDWLDMTNMLLIIDEAQGSYQYDNFWIDFIKRISQEGDEGRRVILFSSYGSPAAMPIACGPVGPPPIELSTDQRASIRSLSHNNKNFSLYFTHPEFDDVAARVCKASNEHEQPFRPSPELLEYVWEFFNGHPGGTRAVLDIMINSEVGVYSFITISVFS